MAGCQVSLCTYIYSYSMMDSSRSIKYWQTFISKHLKLSICLKAECFQLGGQGCVSTFKFYHDFVRYILHKERAMSKQKCPSLHKKWNNLLTSMTKEPKNSKVKAKILIQDQTVESNLISPELMWPIHSKWQTKLMLTITILTN